jgi:hypothetical protein
MSAYEVPSRKANGRDASVIIVGKQVLGRRATAMRVVLATSLAATLALTGCTPSPGPAESTRTPSAAAAPRATLTPTPVATSSPTSAAEPVFATGVDAFAQMLATLPVDDQPESYTGYVRDYFELWVDANGNGCNTRAEVLIAQSQAATTRRGSCTIDSGSWISLYDNATFSVAGDLDIDHVVPLSEAWKSGAWQWDAATREQFANDLGYPGSLLAVSASSNRSKGDKDPARWMPVAGAVCDYVQRWIGVKFRWSLTVDSAEKTVLSATLVGCAVATQSVPTKATVTRTLNQAPAPVTGGNGSGDGVIDPDYGTCKAAKANGRGPYINGVDPEYAFYRDGDNDGMVCE